jgi:N-acetylneuraminic acid mutarotase
MRSRRSFKSMLARQAALALGTAVLALCAAASSHAQVLPGTWTVKAPMAGGVRGEVAAVAYQDKLYAIGGNVAGNAVPRSEVYDPATNSWRELAPMPIARDHLGLALVNGKIYTFGGFTKTVHMNAGTDVFEYDPATNTWRSRAPMKVALGSVGAAVIDGKIHVLGGRSLDNTKTLPTHMVYDPATDTWKDAAPMTKGRDHMATVVAEGKIHVIGGRFTSPVDRTDMHEIYDPATDSWSSAPPLKTPRSAVAAALYHGMIVVDGGEYPPENKTWTENEAYDLKSKTWFTLAPMPQAGSHGFGAAVIGPSLYFVGGSTLPGGGGLTDRLLMFTLP